MPDNADKIVIQLGLPRRLAYGENRYQSPADLIPIEGNKDALSMSFFNVDSGSPSYISYADGNQIVGILCLLAEAFRKWHIGDVPHIAIVGKHGNPCGAAIDFRYPQAALRKALAGDPTAGMGGEVVTNFPIDLELAKELFAPQPENDKYFKTDIGRANWGLDLIMAPIFSQDAIELLSKRETRRLLSNQALLNPILPGDEFELRPVRGGFLKQKSPNFLLTPESIINAGEIDAFFASPLNCADLLIAWAVCWRASSNTVALANDGMLIGLGCGQQDRIACVRLCIDRATRAGHSTRGSIFASDAFFPYAQSVGPDIDKMLAIQQEIRTIDYHMSAKNMMRELMAKVGELSRLDKREGVELLIDAGCLGGVVPADGNRLNEVQEAFRNAGVSVAYVAPENRGFSKHA